MSEEIFYPDDKPLTWPERKAARKARDPRDWWREKRRQADELAHSHLDPLDLDDPVELSIEYWDIWA